jgi:hypothetical protein
MTDKPVSPRNTTSTTAANGSYRQTVEPDALAQARAGLGVTLARYWLALKRARNAEGATRTATRANARDELEHAMRLRRRVQALQAEQLADTAGTCEPTASQSVRQLPTATADPHRRNGNLLGRLPAQTRLPGSSWNFAGDPTGDGLMVRR